MIKIRSSNAPYLIKPTKDQLNMETTTMQIDEGMKVSTWLRLANFVLDIVFYYILSFIIGIILGIFALIGFEGPLIWLTEADPLTEKFLGCVLLLLYYFFTEGFMQRSIGKLITGTMVVMDDGSKPDLRTVFIRSLCRFIPFEPFSFFGDGRGWHDSAVNTYVVDAKKYKEAVYLKNSFEEIGIE